MNKYFVTNLFSCLVKGVFKSFPVYSITCCLSVCGTNVFVPTEKFLTIHPAQKQLTVIKERNIDFHISHVFLYKHRLSTVNVRKTNSFLMSNNVCVSDNISFIYFTE